MIRGGVGLRSSGGVIGLSLACFGFGSAFAFVVDWALDNQAGALQEARAANLALQQRVQELEGDLSRDPGATVQARTGRSLGEPVKVQTMRVGPDGEPKSGR